MNPFAFTKEAANWQAAIYQLLVPKEGHQWQRQNSEAYRAFQAALETYPSGMEGADLAYRVPVAAIEALGLNRAAWDAHFTAQVYKDGVERYDVSGYWAAIALHDVTNLLAAGQTHQLDEVERILDRALALSSEHGMA